MRQFIISAQRPEYIRRFETGAGAGGTGRHRHVLERHDQALAFHIIKARIQVTGNPVVEVTIEIDFFHFTQAIPEPVAQDPDTLAFFGHFFFCNTKGLAHANQLMRRQCPGAHTALMATAMHLGFNPNAWFAAYIQGANTLRAINLVGRK